MYHYRVRTITIGLVTPYSLNMRGGVQNITLTLGESLSGLGLKVIYLSPDKQYPSSHQHICIGKSIRLPNPNGSWSELSYPSLSKQQIGSILKKNNIDLLHFQEILSPLACWSLIRRSTVPNIISFHATWKRTILTDLYLTLVKMIIGRTYSQTITSSQISANSNSLLLKKNIIINPGINLPHIQQKQHLNHPKYSLLFVGRLEKRKGVIDLIKAFSHLSPDTKKQTQLLIAGDGPEKSKILSTIIAYNLQDQVVLLGKISDDARSKLIQQSDIFIAPSTYGESFGLVIVEALAQQCPVIVANNVGYRHTLRNYPYPKYILNVKNHHEFASSIETLLTNKTERTNILSWAKTWVKQFDSKDVAKQHLKLYQDILSNH